MREKRLILDNNRYPRRHNMFIEGDLDKIKPFGSFHYVGFHLITTEQFYKNKTHKRNYFGCGNGGFFVVVNDRETCFGEFIHSLDKKEREEVYKNIGPIMDILSNYLNLDE